MKKELKKEKEKKVAYKNNNYSNVVNQNVASPEMCPFLRNIIMFVSLIDHSVQCLKAGYEKSLIF